MGVPDPLSSARAKVARAKEHLMYVEDAVVRWSDPARHEVAAKHNPETGQLQYYLARIADIDEPIPAAIGDVIQNLRSALDHIAYQLVFKDTNGFGIPYRRGKKRKDPFKHVQFPIFDGPSDYESGKHGQIEGMLQPSIDAIDATEPYKTGNDTIWLIGKLNNIDKHRRLVMMGGCTSIDLGGIFARTISKGLFPRLAVPSFSAFVTDGEIRKAGDVLYTDGSPDAKFDANLRFPPLVAFNEIGVIERKPVIKTLHEMVDLVDGVIIPGFERCFV